MKTTKTTASSRKLKKYSKPGEGATIKPKQVKKNPGKAGRRKIVLPVDQAEGWGYLHATHTEMAGLCGVSSKTIQREFESEPETEFVQLYKRGQQKSKINLRRRMITKALDMDNAAISIFTAKNILNWTDKTEATNEQTVIVRNELGPKPRFAMDLTDDPGARN